MDTQAPRLAARHCNRMEAGSAEENLPTRDFWHVIMVRWGCCLPAGWRSRARDHHTMLPLCCRVSQCLGRRLMSLLHAWNPSLGVGGCCRRGA